MIQVLTRAFAVFQELSRKGECSLEELARATRLNKGTLCNILRTLIELNCIEKSVRGSYRIGEGFYSLARNRSTEKYHAIIRRTAEALAGELGESVVISTLRNDRVEIMTQAQVQRHLMINSEITYKDLSLYHSVSGRILYSFLPREERRRLFESYGPPQEQWGGYSDFPSLETAVKTICEESISIMTNPAEGIKSFAVPMYDPAGKVTAALGVTLPIFRLSSDRESALVESMRNAARRVTDALSEMEES